MLNNAGDTKEYGSLWKIMLQMKKRKLSIWNLPQKGR